MRKTILFLVLCCILAACNPGAGSPTPAGPDEASPTSKPTIQSVPTGTPTPIPTPITHPSLLIPTEELNNLQLLFWHPWSGEMAQALETIIRDFNNSNVWGIQVFTTPFGGSGALASAYEQNQTGGLLPDVLAAPSEQILLWNERNSPFIDLDIYISDRQWGLTEQERAEIPPLFWEQDRSAGGQVGVPALRDARVLFYNQSWAQELGFFNPPQSFQDFSTRSCAAAAQRKDIDQTGGWIIDSHPLTTYSWLLTGSPPALYDPDQGQYQFDNRQVARVFSNLKALSISSCIWNARLPDPYDYFASRQALLYSASVQDVIVQTAAMQRNQNSDEWLILPFPGDGDKPVVVMNGISYAISQSKPADQLAAWLFVRWLMLPRHQAMLSAASGYLPVSSSALNNLLDFRTAYPQWETALQWVPFAASPPTTGSWTIVQNILEDAAWQILQPFTTLEGIPPLLEQLDAMIPEVLSANPSD